jgi:protein SCO1/2
MNYLAKIKNVVFAAAVLFLAVGICPAQGGSQHYKSPLYSPRSYEESAQTTLSSGLPNALDNVGIDQKLNETLPLDTKFKDENGREVSLSEYFGKGKPVILALVYYECPMLCNEVLNGLTRGIKPLSFNAGKEFDVVAISFDPKDTPEIARAKKEGYLSRYDRPGTEKGWHFLTATPEAIETITKAVGFKYRWDEKSKQFAHAGGIMIATPEGKLARYFFGIDYPAKDIKLGLIESSNNKIGTPADQLLLYCFHYDPASGKYGFAVMNLVRLGGVLTLIGVAGMLIFFWRYKGNKTAQTADTV